MIKAMYTKPWYSWPHRKQYSVLKLPGNARHCSAAYVISNGIVYNNWFSIFTAPLLGGGTVVDSCVKSRCSFSKWKEYD